MKTERRNKISPAPWKVDLTLAHFAIDVVDKDGHTVTTMMPLKRKTSAAKNNARLIAAAPELLEACRSALATTKGANDDAVDRQLLRTAIARATGEDTSTY